MWTRNQMIEERNYWNDHRVMNAEWYANRRVDEDRMVIFLTLTDDEGEEVEHALPARYDVCPACEGRGKHVDPNIDASGWRHEDDSHDPWDDEDDDGRTAYQRGVYDVPCATCHGKRVVLEVDTRACDPKVLEAWSDQCEDDAEYAAMVRAERAFGC